MTKALFIDRDGVINIEKNYLHKKEDFEFIDGVFAACELAESLGFLNIVITNQSGIGRGYYSSDDYEKLTSWMVDEFVKNRVKISKVLHCPHTDESECECRKPKPGMILEAQKKFDIDLKKSWLIGDKESDIEAGVNAGIGHLVIARSGHKIDEHNTKADYIVDSIADIGKILRSDI
jgi:D-glycero-D-manno-heptose 1,7-bisphosphate phosphatase